MLRFKGFMDLHWDVIITSAKEVLFLSVLLYCEIGPYSVRYDHRCVAGMNVMFARICIWAGIMHHHT